MSASDDLARILFLASAFEFQKLTKAWQTYARAGLPSSSLPGGNGQGDLPLPVFDGVDNLIFRAQHDFIAAVHDAVNPMERAFAIQGEWLNVRQPSLAAAPVYLCSNARGRCTNTLEDGRQSGECARCRQWRSRHDGQPYPVDPAAAKNTRVVT